MMNEKNNEAFHTFKGDTMKLYSLKRDGTTAASVEGQDNIVREYTKPEAIKCMSDRGA